MARPSVYAGVVQLGSCCVAVLLAQDGKGMRCEIWHDNPQRTRLLWGKSRANLPTAMADRVRVFASRPGGTETLGRGKQWAGKTRMGLDTVLRMHTRLTD